MPSPTIEDFTRQDRVNELALRLLRLPTWTPAFGAMLLYGIRPRPGAQDIPATSRLLEDQRKRATAAEVARARMIMNDWVEFFTLDQEPDAVVPSETTPAYFLEWAEEEYPSVNRPPWLEFFLELRWQPSAPDPRRIPSGLVKRIIELETTVAERQRLTTPAAGVRPNRVARGSSSPIPDLILQAQAVLPPGEVLIATAVMPELLKIAQTSGSGRVRLDQAGFLEVFRARRGWVRYSVKSLQKFLDKRDRDEVLRLIGTSVG